MKNKEQILREIDSLSIDFSDCFIGYRPYPESLAILKANGVNLIYAENCNSEDVGKSIVDHFIAQGMSLDDKYSLNIAKGIFIYKK
jgi:hypothetical protein